MTSASHTAHTIAGNFQGTYSKHHDNGAGNPSTLCVGCWPFVCEWHHVSAPRLTGSMLRAVPRVILRKHGLRLLPLRLDEPVHTREPYLKLFVHSTRLIAKYRLYIDLRLTALDNIFARQKGLPPGHVISSS